GQQLSQVNSQLIVAQAERAQAEARLKRARQVISSGGAAGVSDVQNSPLIQRLREQETELLRKEAEFSQRYGARHPDVINLRAQIKYLRDAINLEVNKVLGALESDFSVAKAREDSLAQSLTKLQAQVA